MYTVEVKHASGSRAIHTAPSMPDLRTIIEDATSRGHQIVITGDQWESNVDQFAPKPQKYVIEAILGEVLFRANSIEEARGSLARYFEYVYMSNGEEVWMGIRDPTDKRYIVPIK